ncbi:MAG: 50S ribosomal protein L35 [Chloroflexota bacterium]
MPKLKTHKGIQKRIRITATGKIMHAHQGKSHLKLSKSKRVKRSHGEMAEIAAPLRKRIKRLLPYGV